MHVFVLPAVLASVYGVPWTLPLFWWHAHLATAIQKAQILPRPS